MQVEINSQPQSPENPNGTITYAGKFTSVGELEKSYMELQSKLGAQSNAQAEPNAATTETPTQVDTVPASTSTAEESPYGTAITQVLIQANLSPEDMTNTLTETGAFSEEQYNALEGLGYPRAMVDTYAAGYKAQLQSVDAETEKLKGEIVQTFGGEQAQQAIYQWAEANKVGMADTFNAALDKGDAGGIKAAAIALRSLYEQANGKELSTPQGVPVVGGTKGSAAPGFASKAQMMSAIQDPRYSSDSAYRVEVQQRITATEGMEYTS